MNNMTILHYSGLFSLGWAYNQPKGKFYKILLWPCISLCILHYVRTSKHTVYITCKTTVEDMSIDNCWVIRLALVLYMPLYHIVMIFAVAAMGRYRNGLCLLPHRSSWVITIEQHIESPSKLYTWHILGLSQTSW